MYVHAYITLRQVEGQDEQQPAASSHQAVAQAQTLSIAQTAKVNNRSNAYTHACSCLHIFVKVWPLIMPYH